MKRIAIRHTNNSGDKWRLLELEKLPLDEWEKIFYEKGGKQLVEFTPPEVWLRFVENAGTRIAECVRKEEYMEAIESLGEAFGWLCCFVKKFRESCPEIRPLSRIAWDKYPGMCYACADKIPENEVTREDYVSCICLGMKGKPTNEQKSERHLEYARKKKKKPTTLDDWAGMIKSIYKEAHAVLPISAICLHFIEEVGEVTRELYEYDELKKRKVPEGELNGKIKKLEEEIADAFSWIFGLINKIDQLFDKARSYYEEKAQLPPLKASEIAREALKTFPERKEHE